MVHPAQGRPGWACPDASGPPCATSPSTKAPVVAATQATADGPDSCDSRHQPVIAYLRGLEDFLLHVAVADNKSLYGFVIDRLTQRPEIADVRTSVVYEHVRNHDIAPA